MLTATVGLPDSNSPDSNKDHREFRPMPSVRVLPLRHFEQKPCPAHNRILWRYESMLAPLF